MPEQEVIIVGGGLAGLCCASRLHRSGVSSLVLEAADQVGGRTRSDCIDGFLLDRGFQVLLTAYPEAKQILDYRALKLRSFEPGALVRYQGKFCRFVDPWRRPGRAFNTVFSPVAGLADKLRVAKFRRRVCRGSLEELYLRPEESTLARLGRKGFTDQIIERFSGRF